jgi:hypothetical protein
MYGSKESDPLVPALHSSSEIVYSPLDEHSRKIQQRRRWTKLGGTALLVAGVVVGVASVVHPSSSAASRASAAGGRAAPPLVVEVDHLFAGLLADDEAFYFPTANEASASPASRRFLRALAAAPDAPPSVSWSYDWQTNAKDAAAIGEYYRAKGLALADYYRSKYDVSTLLRDPSAVRLEPRPRLDRR